MDKLCLPANSYVEVLIPNKMFGDEALGVRWSLQDETLMMGLVAFQEEQGDALSAKWGHNEKEAIFSSDDKRQEEGSYQEPNQPAPFILIGLSSFWNCEN